MLISNNEIFRLLKEEFISVAGSSYSKELYNNFLKEKNLGIVYFKSTFFTSRNDFYYINDSKKWMLAKIKYGF